VHTIFQIGIAFIIKSLSFWIVLLIWNGYRRTLDPIHPQCHPSLQITQHSVRQSSLSRPFLWKWRHQDNFCRPVLSEGNLNGTGTLSSHPNSPIRLWIFPPSRCLWPRWPFQWIWSSSNTEGQIADNQCRRREVLQIRRIQTKADGVKNPFPLAIRQWGSKGFTLLQPIFAQYSRSGHASESPDCQVLKQRHKMDGIR